MLNGNGRPRSSATIDLFGLLRGIGFQGLGRGVFASLLTSNKCRIQLVKMGAFRTDLGSNTWDRDPSVAQRKHRELQAAVAALGAEKIRAVLVRKVHSKDKPSSAQAELR
jgi:hypothetical protein